MSDRLLREGSCVKVLTAYTIDQEPLCQTFLKPSLPECWELIECRIEGTGGAWRSRAFREAVRYKSRFVRDFVLENQGQVFLWADADVQFVTQPDAEKLLAYLGDNDIACQLDRAGHYCSGFFVVRANRRTSEFFMRIAASVEEFYRHYKIGDQVFFNEFKDTVGIVPLPWDEYWTTRYYWLPGDELLVPSSVVMHHANFTSGVQNKLQLLRAVRNIVSSRSADGRLQTALESVSGSSLRKLAILADDNQGRPGWKVVSGNDGLTPGSYDFVYVSGQVERMSRPGARAFLMGCFNLLTDEGRIRLAVPDFEKQALAYLTSVQALRQEPVSSPKLLEHQWNRSLITHGLLRSSPGEAHEFYDVDCLPSGYVPELAGSELLARKESIETARRERKRVGHPLVKESKPKSLRDTLSMIWNRVAPESAVRAYRSLRRVLNLHVDFYRIGRYRCSGGPEQGKFDFPFVENLLRECGFSGIQRRDAQASCMRGWPVFEFDSDAHGFERRPDCMYIEARKLPLSSNWL